MKKDLKKMSNEELWHLFPIVLKKHNKKWKNRFDTEKSAIISAVGINNIEKISHIGSTAVAGIKAKPTIDILLEIVKDIDLKQFSDSILKLGYIFSPQPNNPPPHMMFMKGYTVKGFKGQIYHLHIRYKGEWDEIYFRDYLIKNKSAAKEYEHLKIRLSKQYKYNRDAYTESKGEFVRKYTLLERNKND